MNQVFFLDVVMFIFFLQYLFYYNEAMIYIFSKKFMLVIKEVLGLSNFLPLSSVISLFTFLVLLVSCFGGYFTYSFCPCGMIEFTFLYASVAWLSALMTFIAGDKFSVYLSKAGDKFVKTFSMLMVEVVSEFSRPLALTVRLTVNVMVGHLVSMMLFMFFDSFCAEAYVWVSALAIAMECFVFFIQSYIFSRLIFLYLSE